MKTQKQTANEAIARATEEVENVVQMSRASPATIQLTVEERLEVENLHLKKQLMKTEFEAAGRALMDVEKGWIAKVTARVGADIRRYNVDPQTGTCKLRQEGDDGAR